MLSATVIMGSLWVNAPFSMVCSKLFFFTFTTLWANSADNILMTSYFSQKTGFDISSKQSPLETICMKNQNLFSVKNKKNISKCHLLKFLLRELNVKLCIKIRKMLLNHFITIKLNNPMTYQESRIDFVNTGLPSSRLEKYQCNFFFISLRKHVVGTQ